MTWRLESPLALLLALIALVVVFLSSARRRGAVRISTLAIARGIPVTVRQRLAWLPTAMRALAVVALAVAAARPQAGIGEVRTTADGVAMMVVLDRSWSMSEVIEAGNPPKARIDVVRRVLREFLEGNGDDLDGRAQDLIGLVTFGRYADTVCPLVQDHSGLIELADGVRLADPRGSGAGTAIGEGLALAAARLKTAEEELAERNEGEEDPAFEIKSKVIVLLTDGDENITTIPAMQAAQICADWGIKVYAIGIGGGRDRMVDTMMGQVRAGPRYPFNDRLLRAIAQRTGGEMYAAENAGTLRDVYEEIDKLEKTEIESTEFTRYRELFPWFAVVGGALLALDLVLSVTWLRRTP